MNEWIPVIVCIISGLFTMAGVVITARANLKEITHRLETHQAVTDTKIENLTSEVKSHNNFAVKIPVIEQRLTTVESGLNDLRKEITK